MSDDEVDIVIKARLWAAIPTDERLTHADIDRAVQRTKTAYGWDQSPSDLHYRKLIDNPDCEIAVRVTGYGGDKWAPCGNPAFGADRCKKHGGPGRPSGQSRPNYVNMRYLKLAEAVETVIVAFAPIESAITFTDADREAIHAFMDSFDALRRCVSEVKLTPPTDTDRES
jgi:hypothetical protein